MATNLPYQRVIINVPAHHVNTSQPLSIACNQQPAQASTKCVFGVTKPGSFVCYNDRYYRWHADRRAWAPVTSDFYTMFDHLPNRDYEKRRFLSCIPICVNPKPVGLVTGFHYAENNKVQPCQCILLNASRTSLLSREVEMEDYVFATTKILGDTTAQHVQEVQAIVNTIFDQDQSKMLRRLATFLFTASFHKTLYLVGPHAYDLMLILLNFLGPNVALQYDDMFATYSHHDPDPSRFVCFSPRYPAVKVPQNRIICLASRPRELEDNAWVVTPSARAPYTSFNSLYRVALLEVLLQAGHTQ